jgi:hypothetical protein
VSFRLPDRANRARIGRRIQETRDPKIYRVEIFFFFFFCCSFTVTVKIESVIFIRSYEVLMFL